MNKLRALLVAAALLTVACGTATISGSQVGSVSNAGNALVDTGANAGTDLAAAASDDLGRANPPVRKGPAGLSPVQRSLQPSTVGTQPSTLGRDRCSNGFGGGVGVAPRVAGPGKQPPQPACAVE